MPHHQFSLKSYVARIQRSGIRDDQCREALDSATLHPGTCYSPHGFIRQLMRKYSRLSPCDKIINGNTYKEIEN